MDELKDRINQSRNIKENSLKQYLITINRLAEVVTGQPYYNQMFLLDTFKVLKHLQKLSESTRKNYLIVIVVVLSSFNEYEKELEIYRSEMDNVATQLKKDQVLHIKTSKQEKNWVSLQYLYDIREDLGELVDELNEPDLTPKQFFLLQQYLVAGLYTLIPPVRLDYGNMRMIEEKEFNRELKGNYMIYYSNDFNRKTFVINDYKTDGVYGSLDIEAPEELSDIINLWLMHNTTDWFLLNSKYAPMSADSLGKFISKVFSKKDKKVTINIIRHVYITEKFNVVDGDERSKTAKIMGHSLSTQNEYAKY